MQRGQLDLLAQYTTVSVATQSGLSSPVTSTGPRAGHASGTETRTGVDTTAHDSQAASLRPRVPFSVATEISRHIHAIAESLVFLVYLRRTPSFRHNAEHWRRWNSSLKKFVALCYQEAKHVRSEQLTVADVVKWIPPVNVREVERALGSVEEDEGVQPDVLSQSTARSDADADADADADGDGDGDGDAGCDVEVAGAGDHAGATGRGVITGLESRDSTPLQAPAPAIGS
ncbi:hypothetical protein KEM52_001692 [Ascosphaera acerosa]|nr:hypothetical protein KEM52_001692 [Ascosphaera acerosa]